MKSEISRLEDDLYNELDIDAKERSKLILEQYKLYVEMTDRISERRHKSNSFFLTINTILISSITGFLGLNQEFSTPIIWVIAPIVVGIIISWSWLDMIQSYNQHNAGKFRVIHALEKQLPANIYKVEWDALTKSIGTSYKPFTQIEKNIPIVFISLYLLIGIITVFLFN